MSNAAFSGLVFVCDDRNCVFVDSCTRRETKGEGKGRGGGGEHQQCKFRYAGREGPGGWISSGTKDRHLYRCPGNVELSISFDLHFKLWSILF